MDDLEDVVFEDSEVLAIKSSGTGYVLAPADRPVVAEVSLKIHVNGQEIASLLCLNQQQVPLALGFLYSEGVIDSYDDVHETCYNAAAQLVRVELASDVSVSRQQSLRSVTAGCGKCFTYINPLRQSQFHKVKSSLRPSLVGIMRRMAEFTQKSSLYHSMGGVHSLLLDVEGLSVFSEDIGRHNCLDKVTGTLLQDGRLNLAQDGVVYISGRVTSEIMTKLIRLGAPMIVSKSTPSVSAVKLASQYGVTLLGYVKDDSGYVYSGAERLLTHKDSNEGGECKCHKTTPTAGIEAA
jgi:FdhD protein